MARVRNRHPPVGFLPATRCVAHSTQTGLPCKNWAIRGGTVCRKHGGSVGRVKAKAAERVRDALAMAIDPERVLREVGRLAFSDIRELFDDAGKLLPVKQWPEDIARAVKSVEVVRGNVDKGDGKYDEVVKIQLWDKPRPGENLMKHHGQLTDKLELSGDAELLARLDAGRLRAAGAQK